MAARRPTSQTGAVTVRLFSLALVVGLVAGGCAFRTAREVKKTGTVWFIGGSVKAPGGTAGTYVLLYAIGKDGKILIDGIIELSDLTSNWSFMCQEGDQFVVGAFKDLNGNGLRDPGEPAGCLGADAPLALSARAQVTGLAMTLDRATATRPKHPLDTHGEASGRLAAVRFSMGEVVKLDDPRFDSKKASAGLWTPLEALRSSGAGVFFLQPYDPKRIPIIFVHGIGGVPKDFSVLIDRLDKSRYQPWVFYYQSRRFSTS